MRIVIVSDVVGTWAKCDGHIYHGERQRTASFRCAPRKPEGPGAVPVGNYIIMQMYFPTIMYVD